MTLVVQALFITLYCKWITLLKENILLIHFLSYSNYFPGVLIFPWLFFQETTINFQHSQWPCLGDSVPSGDLEAKIIEASIGKFASIQQSMKRVRALHFPALAFIMERYIKERANSNDMHPINWRLLSQQTPIQQFIITMHNMAILLIF